VEVVWRHVFPANKTIYEKSIVKDRSKLNKDLLLLGPFPSKRNLYMMLKQIQSIFKIRDCSDDFFNKTKRPCIKYQIKLCTAPCVNYINKKNYLDSINNFKNFLNGNRKTVIENLTEKMTLYSSQLRYEEAAGVRDVIKSFAGLNIREDIKNHNSDIIIFIKTSSQIMIHISFYRLGILLGDHPYIFDFNSDDISNISENKDKQEYDLFLKSIIQIYEVREISSHIYTNMIISSEDRKFTQDVLTSLAIQKHQDNNSNIKIYSSSNNILVKESYQRAYERFKIHIKNKEDNFKILKNIKEIFSLTDIPTRIELYDNSHIQGKYAVGAMVVLTDGKFDKKEYRTFDLSAQYDNLKSDDYFMMREVMKRRVARYKKDPNKIPNLIIIDGGKGHLSVCAGVIANFSLKIDVISMSKGKYRNKGGEYFHTTSGDSFTMSNDNGIMQYMQVMRDEVHNYAISNYRKKHSKSLSLSSLDKIPSIGDKRKKSLLLYFGSFQKIKEASINEIAKVSGISMDLAKTIFNYLR
ncbi:MAG TPA: excinuclease ABC subunit UvrC, partial [Candidatus Megaira endosymbiont of Hartmannula sinica]|nr:excinuclease ABC subunit UvrC [Candidatus Megaera endosymbiont of Hartmannula sinica]